jgi:hypothetical protein
MSKSFREIAHLASRESLVVIADCLIAQRNHTIGCPSFPS